MTGVAAQMCGDKATVESLGVTKQSPEQKYRVEDDGTILERQVNEEGKAVWAPFSPSFIVADSLRKSLLKN